MSLKRGTTPRPVFTMAGCRLVPEHSTRRCSFTQSDMSSVDLQGCGGDCVRVCAKALASFHVLKLAEGVSIAVLGVPLAWLGRIALPCSVPVTCGTGKKSLSLAA